jgi:ATP-binding cassette subfamily B protein
MAPKPPSSDDQMPAAADDPAVPELDEKLAADAEAAARAAGGKPAAAPPDDDEDDDELDLEDDEEDEDLVVFTAKEAAGALATIYAFVKPFLKNYKKILTFVGLGVVVETLFNVIMPLSLKFLIDDALGEEDFEALVKILSVLAVAGIVTSIVAVWYERWDAKLAASLISDVRTDRKSVV